jgi:zinc protease
MAHTECENGTRDRSLRVPRCNIRNRMRITRRLVPVIVFLCLAIVLGAERSLAQSPAARTFNPQEPIPFDGAVVRGTLANGLQFFIRQNPRPAKRVLLRLAVKAGSMEEAADQQGLAHFIEHMAFNGSEHFASGELVKYFESTGARLGPHVNAYTSFDETVYMLELPSDKADIVSKGFTALADFAGGLSFIPAEVEKERGVVIEEWRGRLGAGSRISDKQLPVLYYNSRYAERLPIGKPDIIRSAPPERLRSFYDAWYRPEKMAVVVVGDFDPKTIEGLIRSAFGGIKPRAAVAPLPDTTVPIQRDLLVNIATDAELTRSSVEIVRKRSSESQKTTGDYRQSLVESLFRRMFNERFSDLTLKPDAKFLSAGAGGGGLGRTVDTFSVRASVADGKLVDGLVAIETETRRVREFGFTAPELDRAKKSMLAGYERAFNERDKEESGGYAREYVSYFLDDEPSPGIEFEYGLALKVIPDVTLDEVARLARRLLADDSRVVLAVSPQKQGISIPSESDLRAALDSASKVAVTPWNETVVARALMETPPPPAAIESRRSLPDVGVTVLRFANGVEAWLKPTDFKNDQVIFSMYSWGGLSLASKDDFIEASLADTYVGFSGVGGIKALDLDKMMAGKRAGAAPFLSLSTHGISGSAAPTELETALQLLYQTFVAPGDDPDAFALMKRQLASSVANRGQSPGQVFAEKLEDVNTSHHFTSEPLTPERVETIDRAKVIAFYKERFANAADFTFFMVGSFKPDDVMPVLARYLGTLPSTGKKTSDFKDLGIHFPASIERARVEKGREPRSQTVISFFADPPADSTVAERINAATTVLQTRLRDVLREELGQTYTVSVGLSQELPQKGGGYMRVTFGAAPENIQAMTDRVIAEVKRLQQEGPSADLVESAKETARRGYETSLKENGYWLRRLQTVQMFGAPVGEILTRPARIDAVTTTDVQDVFKTYFPLDRFTMVTLVPAATAP